MQSHKLTTAFWASLLALAGCSARDAAAPVIRIDGSGGVQPLVAALADEYTRVTGVRFALASGLGSSARAAAVADSTIDIAMASHGIDSVDLARRGLVAHEIARAAVVFAVNGDVQIPAITGSQVCDIVAGRASNWSRFGAGNLPIVPMMRPPTEVDAEVALAHVPCLRGLAHGANVRVIARPDSMAATLERTTGAFGVTSALMVERSGGKMRALALDGATPTRENVRSGAYPLARSSYLIVKAQPAPHVARFLGFIQDSAGARIITANGAVTIDP